MLSYYDESSRMDRVKEDVWFAEINDEITVRIDNKQTINVRQHTHGGTR